MKSYGDVTQDLYDKGWRRGRDALWRNPRYPGSWNRANALAITRGTLLHPNDVKENNTVTIRNLLRAQTGRGYLLYEGNMRTKYDGIGSLKRFIETDARLERAAEQVAADYPEFKVFTLQYVDAEGSSANGDGGMTVFKVSPATVVEVRP